MNFPGARETRREVRHKVCVQRVQPRVPAAQRHQPRGHQVFAVAGRRADRGGAAAPARHHRQEHPHPETLSRGPHATHTAAAIPYC